MSACDIRFDETLERTHPARARAVGASQATTGARARRVEGQARAHERRVQGAADAYAALHAHATRVKRARGEYVGGAVPFELFDNGRIELRQIRNFHGEWVTGTGMREYSPIRLDKDSAGDLASALFAATEEC